MERGAQSGPNPGEHEWRIIRKRIRVGGVLPAQSRHRRRQQRWYHNGDRDSGTDRNAQQFCAEWRSLQLGEGRFWQLDKRRPSRFPNRYDHRPMDGYRCQWQHSYLQSKCNRCR